MTGAERGADRAGGACLGDEKRRKFDRFLELVPGKSGSKAREKLRKKLRKKWNWIFGEKLFLKHI